MSQFKPKPVKTRALTEPIGNSCLLGMRMSGFTRLRRDRADLVPRQLRSCGIQPFILKLFFSLPSGTKPVRAEVSKYERRSSIQRFLPFAFALLYIRANDG